MRNLTVIAVGLMAMLGCSQARPLEGESPKVSWDVVGPDFAERCNTCHSGSAAAAGYRTTSYLEALGPKDKPVATAGDADSLLLRTLDPAKASAAHVPVSGLYDTVRAWVVEGRLSFKALGVHQAGILNPNDAEQFHGVLLSDRGWDLSFCARCHGNDFTGGLAKLSCAQCHSQGLASCQTCHGQPPVSGAHLAHFTGTLGRKLDCGDCHVKPANWDAPGHLGPKAVVTFGAQAALPGPGRTGAPSFDGATCSNVQCHGGAVHDAAATNTQPQWTGGSALCGACHGLPPASHAPSSTDCGACHWLVVKSGQTITNPALHIDGVVEVSDGTNGCFACHGSAQSPAPPRDLSGNTETSALGVGAHQAHLQGEHRISAPVACSACHLVPTTVGSPGHVDQDPPAHVLFSGLAVADLAAPVWTRSTASCSATYCHGNGQGLASDTSEGLSRTPVWTSGVDQVACGSCHGVPPTDPNHTPSMRLGDCATCHANTVAPSGVIIVTGPPEARVSAHINGVADVTAP